MICGFETYEEVFDLTRVIVANMDKLKYILILS